ncbi:MAG TPA: thioesterase family protein [Candidatus Kapabacteria bacterium]
MPTVSHTTTLRVRYADTDQMGIVYYAKYLEYFEVARTETLRAIGLPYAELEQLGFMLPVADASIKYYSGAAYDDEIDITATLEPANSPRVPITYRAIRKKDGVLLVEGSTTLVFVNRVTNRPCKPPAIYLETVGIA